MKAGKWIAITLAIILALVFGGVCQADDEDPVIDNSRTTKKLQSIKRPKGQRKVVTIYEFRSSVPEVNGAAATDMFTTALIKSGYFAVAERQRLDQGVMREKQLQGSGAATGRRPSLNSLVRSISSKVPYQKRTPTRPTPRAGSMSAG